MLRCFIDGWTPPPPRRRGMALVLVLTISLVLFLLGSAVAAMCIGQGQLALAAEQGTQIRETALAGLAEARCLLDQFPSWAGLAFPASGEIIQPDSRYNLYVRLALDPSTMPTANTAVFLSTAYIKDDRGNPQGTLTLRGRFQRDMGAFRYPVEVLNSLSMTRSSVYNAPSLPQEVAVYIATSASGSSMDTSSSINGDLLVYGGGTLHGSVQGTVIAAPYPPSVFPCAVPSSVPSNPKVSYP